MVRGAARLERAPRSADPDRPPAGVAGHGCTHASLTERRTHHDRTGQEPGQDPASEPHHGTSAPVAREGDSTFRRTHHPSSTRRCLQQLEGCTGARERERADPARNRKGKGVARILSGHPTPGWPRKDARTHQKELEPKMDDLIWLIDEIQRTTNIRCTCGSYPHWVYCALIRKIEGKV